jgi:cytochrome c oxidase subunit 1
MSTLVAPVHEPPSPSSRVHYLNASYGIRSWLFTTDHKRIALLYLGSITFMFLVGGIAPAFD